MKWLGIEIWKKKKIKNKNFKNKNKIASEIVKEKKKVGDGVRKRCGCLQFMR